MKLSCIIKLLDCYNANVFMDYGPSPSASFCYTLTTWQSHSLHYVTGPSHSRDRPIRILDWALSVLFSFWLDWAGFVHLILWAFDCMSFWYIPEQPKSSDHFFFFFFFRENCMYSIFTKYFFFNLEWELRTLYILIILCVIFLLDCAYNHF